MPRVSDAHLEARRRQILEAAGKCFAREGFHQTSMQDILEESKLSTGAIYRYFENKDELIEAIAEEVLHTAEGVWGRGDRDEGRERDLSEVVVDRLFGVLEGFSLEEEDERVRLAVQLCAEALRNPRVLALLQRSIDRFRTEIDRRVADGQARGQIDGSLDPDSVARTIGALFQGFVLQRALWEDLDRSAYRTAAKAMVGGLHNRPRPRAKTQQGG